MNKLAQSHARARRVAQYPLIALHGFPSALSHFPWAASLLLSLSALLAPPAYAIDGFVQYKVAWTNLAKCGFTEYTNLDLPRVHIYHQQVTHEVYAGDFYSSTTNTTNITVTSSCTGGGSSTVTYWPGYMYSSYTEDMDATNTERYLDMFCHYTNICSGTWLFNTEDKDTRYRTGIACDNGSICKTNTYDFEYRLLSAQLVQSSGSPTWCWVGPDHVIYTNSGCHTWDNTTNDSTDTWVGSLLIPTPDLVFWELTNLAPTQLEYRLPPEIYEPAGISAHCTFDLSQEYTDGELRTNILALMPPYPADWYPD